MSDFVQKKYTWEDLVKLMESLRNPITGCPWDLEQTMISIAPYAIEEAYEVQDALQRGDMNDFREELGDLLFQPVYQAQLAAEQNLFTIHDIIDDITRKMIARHPHVFGQTTASDTKDVNQIWEEQKSIERQNKGKKNAINNVPQNFPALLRAQKLQQCAAKEGFEWTNLHDVLDKMEEEIEELREALQKGTREDQTEELGDILFVWVNFARLNGINAETCLQACNEKFIKRFNGMEQYLYTKNKTIQSSTPKEQKEAWDKQKHNKNDSTQKA